MSSEPAPQPVTIAGFYIDAFLNESHDRTAEIVDVPVEEGSDLTDHIRNMPVELSVTCLVSDSPIGVITEKRLLEGYPDQKPSHKAYQFMLEIWEKREPVEVVTRLQTYTNMAIQSISITEDAGTGEALEFTVHFKKVEIVRNNRTDIKVRLPRAKKKANRGKKTSKEEAKKEIGKVKTYAKVSKQWKADVYDEESIF